MHVWVLGLSCASPSGPRGFETVGQDRFGDDFLQESSGDEDSASFFERALQECNAHRHDRPRVMNTFASLVGGSCSCSFPACC